MSLLLRRSNSTNNFFKTDARASSNECQTDEVNRPSRFDEDVSNEFVVVNHRSGVVCLVTNYNEIGNTSLGLYIAEERFYNVQEVKSRDLIVELKELISCC